MDLSSHEGGHEIPAIPISSSYAGGGHAHLIHHHHHSHPHPHPHPHPHDPSADAPPLPPLPHNHSIIIPCSAVAAAAPLSNGPVPSSTTTLHHHVEEVEEEEEEEEDHMPYKKSQQAVKYRECLKNHAAAMGGNATDGCGEFMPSGEEGSLEALKCSACNCHRNFHRKEIEGDHHQISSFDFYHHHPRLNKIGMGRKVIVAAGHHHNHKVLGSEALGYPTATGTLIPSSRPAQPPHQHQHPYHHPHPPQMIMSYNLGGSIPSESDEQEGGGGHHHEGILAGARGTIAAHHHHHHHQMVLKKRFRTKFTPEQKEKMLGFAEKVGWRIQKQEESVVQQFCQEIGVKRRVLKVWMHNNKHNLAKKNTNHSSTT